MDNDEIHFLDTNIILAMVLPNDSSYNICKNYLEYDHVRYLSRTACDEAENKITKIRRISLKITEYTKKYSIENNTNLLKMENHLNKVKKGFLMQYPDNNEFPEGLKKEKFRNLVSNFFNDYYDNLTNILLTQNNDELNNLIRSTFKTSILKFKVFVKEQCPISFIEDATKVKQFKDVGIHRTDAILLEESYFLHKCLNERIYFITFDNGILKLKDSVKEILSVGIVVVHPQKYVN